MRIWNYRFVAIIAAVNVMPFAAVAQESAPTAPSKPPLGNYAPDIKPEALWDGRKMAPFKTLDDPKMVKAAEADYLIDSDYILGIERNGESRAYPTRFIWWHHGINDNIGIDGKGGKSPVAITYCSVCNTGVAYDRMLDGKEVKLDFLGLYNGIVALCERESSSAFLQADGRFVSNTYSGKSLKMLPLLDTTWGEWKKLHPDTLVMSPQEPYLKFYSPKERPELRGYDRFPAPFFKPSVTRGDKRLPPFDKVLGVFMAGPKGSVGEAAAIRRAYPIKTLTEAGGVVNDQMGDLPVAVFLQPGSATASALSRKLGDKTLTFESRKLDDGSLAFFDKETGSRWSIEGKAEEGPSAGKSLERLENHLSQWYGWVAYFPHTTIYGRTDAPQPSTFDEAAGGKPNEPGKP